MTKTPAIAGVFSFVDGVGTAYLDRTDNHLVYGSSSLPRWVNFIMDWVPTVSAGRLIRTAFLEKFDIQMLLQPDTAITVYPIDFHYGGIPAQTGRSIQGCFSLADTANGVRCRDQKSIEHLNRNSA